MVSAFKNRTRRLATAGLFALATALHGASIVAADTTDGTVNLLLDGSSSSASYQAHEQLVGNTLPTPAVGTSHAVTGNVVIAADGSLVPEQSGITVDLSQLQSDEGQRDDYIKSETLQTSQYPNATFVPRQAIGLPSPLPTSGSVDFQLAGDLTVHGVTNPATWQVTAQFSDSSCVGSASTNLKISDFGMTPPRVGPVLSIEDGLTLQLAFTANRQS